MINTPYLAFKGQVCGVVRELFKENDHDMPRAHQVILKARSSSGFQWYDINDNKQYPRHQMYIRASGDAKDTKVKSIRITVHDGAHHTIFIVPRLQRTTGHKSLFANVKPRSDIQ